jgi:hypothetical protein
MTKLRIEEVGIAAEEGYLFDFDEGNAKFPAGLPTQAFRLQSRFS